MKMLDGCVVSALGALRGGVLDQSRALIFRAYQIEIAGRRLRLSEEAVAEHEIYRGGEQNGERDYAENDLRTFAGFGLESGSLHQDCRRPAVPPALRPMRDRAVPAKA